MAMCGDVVSLGFTFGMLWYVLTPRPFTLNLIESFLFHRPLYGRARSMGSHVRLDQDGEFSSVWEIIKYGVHLNQIRPWGLGYSPEIQIAISYFPVPLIHQSAYLFSLPVVAIFVGEIKRVVYRDQKSSRDLSTMKAEVTQKAATLCQGGHLGNQAFCAR